MFGKSGQEKEKNKLYFKLVNDLKLVGEGRLISVDQWRNEPGAVVRAVRTAETRARTKAAMSKTMLLFLPFLALVILPLVLGSGLSRCVG